MFILYIPVGVTAFICLECLTILKLDSQQEKKKENVIKTGPQSFFPIWVVCGCLM